MTTTSAPREVRSAHGGESAPHSSCLPPNEFSTRHIGPRADEIQAMLATLGYDSLDAFIDDVVPETIRLRRPLALAPGLDERAVLTTAQSSPSGTRSSARTSAWATTAPSRRR